jgi:hypothetical protein
MKNLIELLENQPIWLAVWFAIASFITSFLLLKSMKRTHVRLGYSFDRLLLITGFVALGIMLGIFYENFLGVILTSMVPLASFIIIVSLTVKFSDIFGELSGSLMLWFTTFNVAFNTTFLAAKQDWLYLVIVVVSGGVGALIGYLHERRKKTILIS